MLADAATLEPLETYYSSRKETDRAGRPGSIIFHIIAYDCITHKNQMVRFKISCHEVN